MVADERRTCSASAVVGRTACASSCGVITRKTLTLGDDLAAASLRSRAPGADPGEGRPAAPDDNRAAPQSPPNPLSAGGRGVAGLAAEAVDGGAWGGRRGRRLISTPWPPASAWSISSSTPRTASSTSSATNVLSAETAPAECREENAPRGHREQRDVAIRRSLTGFGRITLATLLAEASQPLQRRDYHALRLVVLGGTGDPTQR